MIRSLLPRRLFTFRRIHFPVDSHNRKLPVRGGYPVRHLSLAEENALGLKSRSTNGGREASLLPRERKRLPIFSRAVKVVSELDVSASSESDVYGHQLTSRRCFPQSSRRDTLVMVGNRSNQLDDGVGLTTTIARASSSIKPRDT